MKINIKATAIELTPAINEYVEKKISSLEKYLNSEVVAQVDVGKSTNHHKSGDVFKADVHLIGGGVDLYVSSEQADLYAAIDMVKDELAHKLTHEKGKNQTITRRSAQKVKEMLRSWNPFRKED